MALVGTVLGRSSRRHATRCSSIVVVYGEMLKYEILAVPTFNYFLLININ